MGGTNGGWVALSALLAKKLDEAIVAGVESLKQQLT
jgi:hypothetical protein